MNRGVGKAIDRPIAPLPDSGLAPSILAIIVAHSSPKAIPLANLLATSRLQTVLVRNSRDIPEDSIVENVTVLTTPFNLGFGGAVNYAVAALPAILSPSTPVPDWLLVLNDDITATTGAIDALLEELPSIPNGTGSVGIRLSSEGKSARYKAVFPTLPGILMTSILGEERTVQRLQSEAYPKGAAFAVRFKAFQEIGGFDTRYFLYWEETDLHKRLRNSGYRTTFTSPRVVVDHGESESTNAYHFFCQLQYGFSMVVYARQHSPRLLIPLLVLTIVARLSLLRKARTISSLLSILARILGPPMGATARLAGLSDLPLFLGPTRGRQQDRDECIRNAFKACSGAT